MAASELSHQPGRSGPSWCPIALVLCLTLAGCSALPNGSERPTHWAPPPETLPPPSLVLRTPLPPCGVVVGIPVREERTCILDAYEAGRGAELVTELGPEQFVLIRVHPGRRVIVIRSLRTMPQRQVTWVAEACTSLREEVSGSGTSARIVLNADCNEPLPLVMQPDL
jgi:hypothetical protein